MVLVTQSFGNELEYRRAVYCISSYYAHCNPSKKGSTFLFTDNPAYFEKYLREFPIRYFLLTPERIKVMRGGIDFLHRMKISLIEEAFNETDHNLLYADSDTFFIADPSPLMERVNENTSFMHVVEYSFDSMRHWRLPAGVPFRAFIQLISENEFKLYDNSLMKINTNWSSWNAGVMMLHHTHKKFIPEVYVLTEQFYPRTNNHACEQYAFSIALQNHTSVYPCNGTSYHYWYRVKKVIVDRYLRQELEGIDFVSETFLKKVKCSTLDFPSRVENDVLFLEDEAIQNLNENHLLKGYFYTVRVMIKNPWNPGFLKDVLYHTKRILLSRAR